MSGNEFAKELLETELYRLHPATVPPEDESKYDYIDENEDY